MSYELVTPIEIAILLVAVMLVVVVALRVVYQDAYDDALLGVETESPKVFKSGPHATWLGPETRRVLVELGIENLKAVAALDSAQILAIESRLALGAGRVERERWIAQATDESSGDVP